MGKKLSNFVYNHLCNQVATMMAILVAVTMVLFALQPVGIIAADTTTPTATATPVVNNRAFIRFEVHQTALVDLVGKLIVKGTDYSEETPLSVRAGEKLNAFVMVPEHMGIYHMDLVLAGSTTPALWVEGEITRVSEGEYQHRLIGSNADPAVFVLAPEEEGVIIAIGSVQGHLATKIKLLKASSGLLEVGADANADGNIDPSSEIVSLTLNNQSEASIATPETMLPLTGKYLARFTNNGNIMAYNTGEYDFLNRQGVTVDKDAQSELVEYFSVSFIRLPIATSVKILNASIRPPLVNVHVEPKTEEYTEDIIRHDNPDSVTTAPGVAGTQSATTPASGKISTTPTVVSASTSGLGKFMLANWVWITLGGAVLVAIILIARKPSVSKKE